MLFRLEHSVCFSSVFYSTFFLLSCYCLLLLYNNLRGSNHEFDRYGNVLVVRI